MTDNNETALTLQLDMSAPPPASKRDCLALVNKVDEMIQRLDLSGRWLCGRLIYQVGLSSEEVAAIIEKDHGRKMSKRNIEYSVQLFRAVPELEDVRALESAGCSWTDVKEALPLDGLRRMPELLSAVREGTVTAENIAEKVAELKSIQTLEPLPVDGITSAPAAPLAEPATGGKGHPLVVSAKKQLKALEALHAKCRAVRDTLDTQIEQHLDEIGADDVADLKRAIDEIGQEAGDMSDDLIGLATAAQGIVDALNEGDDGAGDVKEDDEATGEED